MSIWTRIDIVIYRLAKPSIARVFRAYPGIAYGFKLWIDRWLADNPPSESEIKAATLLFQATDRMNDEIVD